MPSEIAFDFFDILFHVFCFLMNWYLFYTTISILVLNCYPLFFIFFLSGDDFPNPSSELVAYFFDILFIFSVFFNEHTFDL